MYNKNNRFMMQFTIQQTKKLENKFSQIEKEEKNIVKQLIEKKKCAEILIQELEFYVKKYKLTQTNNAQIIYYKKCLPFLAKWEIAFHYLCEIEKDLLLGTPKQKIKLVKKRMTSLVTQFKKKRY